MIISNFAHHLIKETQRRMGETIISNYAEDYIRDYLENWSPSIKGTQARKGEATISSFAQDYFA